MFTGLLPRPSLRVFLALAAGTAALALSGCSDSYSTDMQYGLRDDPLILARPTQHKPPRLDPPGELPQFTEMLVQWSKDRNSPDGSTFLPGVLRSWPADNPKARNVADPLHDALEKQFGRPAAPKVGGLTPNELANFGKDSDNADLASTFEAKVSGFPDIDVLGTLHLDDATLQHGSRIYRRLCLHCHGLTGNGRGPTSSWVNPHPRDYREGMFKFISTMPFKIVSTVFDPHRKPSREDLVRVVRQGVDGTSMPAFGSTSGPAFNVLSEDDIHAVVSYVMHLSIRGQVEFEVMKLLSKEKPDTPPDEFVNVAKAVPQYTVGIALEWYRSNDPKRQLTPPKLEPTQEEMARLQELGKSAPTSGQKKEREAWLAQVRAVVGSRPFAENDLRRMLYPLTDDVKTVDKVEGPLSPADVDELYLQSQRESVKRGYQKYLQLCAGCHTDYGRRDNLMWDDWGTIVRPMNLTLGTYRGGRRPIDLYWRISFGIPGANMAGNLAGITGSDDPAKDTDGKMWDVVNFVRAVPFPEMLPEDALKAIYPDHHRHGE